MADASDYGGDYGGYGGGGYSEGYGGDVDYSGGMTDYSGSFMSTSDLPGMEGQSSLDPGMLDTYSYMMEPSMLSDISPMNTESTMSMGDLPGMLGEEDNWGRVRGFLNSPIGKAIFGLVSIANPAVGAFANLAKAGINMGAPGAAGSRAAGSHFGGAIGSGLGGMFGPAGSFAGGQLGSALGGQQGLQGYSGPTAGQPEGAQGGSFMDKMIPTLAGLYAGYQGGRGIGKQIGSLSGMYGQGSPYAQALRQQLERRDAAAGRRSQYGPREVELQAQLARMASSNAPGLAALYGQQNQNRAAMLKALMFGYDQMGGLSGIRGGLQDLFGGGMNLDTGGMGIGDISGGASADYFDPIYGG
jgi:hypothetical protein